MTMLRLPLYIGGLFAAHAAWAADVTAVCSNPLGGPGQTNQPCQFGNAAPNANLLSGTGSATNTGAATIIGAQPAGIKMYISGIQCGRTDSGTLAISATFNDSGSLVMVIPNAGNGGGNNMVFQNPLQVAAATALTFTPSASVTAVFCNAQGYQGK